jgi:DNA topoisomerase-1
MADLGTRGLGRGKVLALVVRLLDETLVRVGNREYARDNKSFGLTTLRRRHLRVEGSDIRLTFRGKGGKPWSVALHSRRLARLVRRLQELPGQELFCYLDEDGTAQRVDSSDVNAYLREASGRPFTAKDFRTWWATVLACRELAALPPAATESEARHAVAAAIKAVARQLGNTPSVCRRSYVHPLVIERWTAGGFAALESRPAAIEDAVRDALSEDEARALELLQSGLEAAEAAPPAERGRLLEKAVTAAESLAS